MLLGKLCNSATALAVVAATRFAGCAGTQTTSPASPGVRHLGDAGACQADVDEAAVAACGWLWENRPEAKEWEYCGVLYLDEKTGDILVGLPERGSRPWQCFPADPPAGTILLGRYHNHRFTLEPSSVDRRIAAAEPQLSNYVCGPSGAVRRFGPREGSVNVR